MNRRILKTFVLMWAAMFASANAEAPSLFDIKARSIDGREVALRDYAGQVLLVVNVASRCGYTGQYAGLQKLYSEYKERGFVVLGFPANDFGGQEPGSEQEIKAFCSGTYGVTFPMFSKLHVIGSEQHPLYRLLTQSTGGAAVGWNFEKFLVGRAGRVLARFGSSVDPSDQELLSALKEALAEPKPK